jgi:hypothetical protein
MTDDAERSAMAEIERNGLCASMMMIATAREIEPEAETDPRYVAAADAIRVIAATMDQISDDVLLRLSSMDLTSEGGLSQLIGARLDQVGFALPLYADAASFFAPIIEQVDAILDSARKHIS